MTPERISVVRYRLERARESLAEARVLLETGHTNTFVKRLYYACFYAASVALLAQGKVATTHGGVRTLLHQHFVKPGFVSVQMGRFFDTLFDNRQKGDYADLVRFDVEEVQGWLVPVDEFIQHVAGITEGLLQAGE